MSSPRRAAEAGLRRAPVEDGEPVIDPVEAAASVLGDRARRDVPLGPLTTYGVGGPAALLLEAGSTDDLELARLALRAAGGRLPVLVVGRGSNLLVADAGFAGLAITLGDGFARIEPGERTVRAGGAVSLPVLARRTAAMGLRGLEWAVGVPGSVGGAVRMNAGGHGSDVRASLIRAWLFDLAAGPSGPPSGVAGPSGPPSGVAGPSGPGSGVAGPSEREVAAGDLALGYRRSNVRPQQVVVAAEFSLTPGDRSEAEAEVSAVVRWRRQHQPGGSNAGSVFANPEGDSAGRLIDAAGLRGHRRGSAFVSPKHANFVQVDAGGSADDVRALIEEVRATVEQRFGVRLELENRLIGYSDISPSTGG